MSGSPAIGQGRDILARAEQLVTARRQADVDDLLTLLVWADTHAGDPHAEPDPVPVGRGGPRLVQVGGQGTPEVVDLCFAEMAIARQAGEVATRNLTADALDLRHRLPQTWAHVQALACETWVARKVARMSRPLTRDAARLVDQAVADAIGQSPSRLLTIAEAKIIEADHAAHQQRVAAGQAKKGVWFPKPPPGDLIDDTATAAGVRSVFGRLDEADAIELEQAIDDLADLLAEHGDHDSDDQPTRDQLRAESLSLLARPADALTLLHGDHPDHDTAEQSHADIADAHRADADDASGSGEGPTSAQRGDGRGGTTRPGTPTRTTKPTRRRARLVVHLSDLTLFGAADGIARVEDYGPMLLEQLTALLGHRDLEILPVVDLRDTRAVTGYEHPTDIRTRTMTRTGGDVFPHSPARPEARVDHDHPTPYDPTGPPGQTGDHNDAPLTRRHHRAKTHLGYRVHQLAPGAYRWATPSGLGRVVTPTGTKCVTLITTESGQIVGEHYPPPSSPVRLEIL